MRQSLKWLICIQAGFVLCAGARATVADSGAQRYGAIPERNVFGLKAPAQTAPPEPQAAPLPKLILTGITTILGNKCALMKQLPTAPKPGEPGRQESLILVEGQREGNVEVLQINEQAGSVKVNNSGTVMTLTFDKDGVKLQTPTAPPLPAAGALGTVPPPLGGIPAAAGTPAATTPYGLPSGSNLSPGMRTLPSRNVRLPATGTTAGNAAVDVPSPTGMVTSPAAPATVQSQSSVTPEERMVLQEVQRELQRQATLNSPNTPATPPLPPGLAPTTLGNGRPYYPQ